MSGFKLMKRALHINVASAEKEPFFPGAVSSFLQTQLNGRIFGALTQSR